MEYLLSILLTVISGVLLAVVKGLLDENRKLREKNVKKENAIYDGMKCLLRIKLIEYHDKYMEEASIPTYAYENWCEMYDNYIALEGNGLVKHMKVDIDDLHLKNK